MSDYTPPMWNTAWSSVGVGDVSGTLGWMSSGAPAAAETNPDSQDIDDKLNLGGAPARWDEFTYDATGPETLVTPPIGNPWSNFGIWFDRDGVDQWQADNWGMIDGVTYNTGGIYDVVVTYHAIDETTGTMFATVNGVQTGFYDTWRNDKPHHYPVGKSISGDLTKLRVFASILGENVEVLGLTAAGCPYWTKIEVDIDIKPGSYPNSINLGSNGVVPVAILSSSSFDATQVDPSTVKLGGAGVAVRGKGSKYLSHEEDVDGDGLTDLVLQVETENLDPNSFQDGYVYLSGELYGTEPVVVVGLDEITIVPPPE